jgi:hypothetical protein
MDTAERVETFARERRHILLASVITYAVWCGGFILSLSQPFASSRPPLLSITTGVFGLLWAGCCLWLVLWVRRVRAHPETLAALNDEMTVRNRWRAQRASAFVLLVCLMLGVVLVSYVDVSARLALLVLIWVLVVSQIGFYLWFDRSE